MKYTLGTLSALLLLAPTLGQADNAADPQREIEALREQNRIIMERLDATAEMLEALSAGGGTAAPAARDALGADHSPFHHGRSGRTTVGAYGEMHLNMLENQGPAGGNQREIDFHRFIIFMGHEFSKTIRFWSELEVEHAQVTGSGGEVAIEQAYLEFDLSPTMQARAGVLLVPVGFINETHEPPTFYGVERPNVDKYILPTTWREGGVSLSGRLGEGWSYDLAVFSGLKITSANYAVRGGRQAVREAMFDDPAYNLRIKWTGVPGLELGATLQRQTNVTQGQDPNAGAATLVEAHAAWQSGPFALRAVYATWDLEGSGPAAVGANEQTGWYVEPSYKVTPEVGVFTRISQWDNAAGDNADSEYGQIDIGLSYWPHPDVVIKLDYQDQSAPAGASEWDGLNLGVGYQF